MCKYAFEVKEISKEEALEMVREYHYSNTLPKLNKHFIGFYLEGKLTGVVTLGWGTRPLHTIQKLFPSLTAEDYYEIGRMCMTEDMPKNSKTQMLSQLVKWMKKNMPEIKVLFTWADGMLGKVGYVYQAANFVYAGYSETDIYMKDGVKIHPRQMKSIFVQAGIEDSRLACMKSIRPTKAQMAEFGFEHYKGNQYKYFMILSNDKHEKQKLTAEWEEIRDSIINNSKGKVSFERPKDSDLKWRKLNLEDGKWHECEKPPYRTDIDITTRDMVNITRR